MTQALYAHMNNKTIKKKLMDILKKKRNSASRCLRLSWRSTFVYGFTHIQ
jgi:hypothetical protein